MSENSVQNHEFGHVNISDDVIGIITNIAASEIKGIALQGSFAGDIAEILGKKNMTKGVRVSITEENVVTVDLNLIDSVLLNTLSYLALATFSVSAYSGVPNKDAS